MDIITRRREKTGKFKLKLERVLVQYSLIDFAIPCSDQSLRREMLNEIMVSAETGVLALES